MRRAVVLAALVAAACSKEDDAPRPDPARRPAATARRSPADCLARVQRVAAAIATAPMAGRPDELAVLGCPELYQRPGCAQAWSALYGDPPPADAEVAIERVVTACAAAYCPGLPAGIRACGPERPRDRSDSIDRLIELDRAVLAAEGFETTTVELLSRRSFVLREVTVEKGPPGDRPQGAPR